jgi:putative ABC transport system ATP-binding protein
MSRRAQIRLLMLILLSLPVYFAALEMPVVIVNEGILGEAFEHGATARLFGLTLPLPASLGGSWTIFGGIEVDQLGFLLVSSAVFLLLILVNTGFKYAIELQKGRIAIAVTQTLQEEVTDRLLAARPEACARLKSGEIAAFVRADIEPIGAYAGSAFGTPLVQIGHAVLALVFIALQSALLGALAAIMLLLQFWIVPRLGHHEVHLQAVRRAVGVVLGGRVGDLAAGLVATRAERVASYEAARMHTEFGRYATAAENALRWAAITHAAMGVFSQLSRLAMFVVGGLLTFGKLILIGNLVAVLNAFRELPETVEELLKWHHKLHDTTDRFSKVQGFLVREPQRPIESEQPPSLAYGRLKTKALSVETSRGLLAIDKLDLNIALPAHVGLVDKDGEAGATLAALLGSELTSYQGRIHFASTALEDLSPELLGRELGYVGPQPHVFDASVRANVSYGLNRRTAVGEGGDWVDLSLAGAEGPRELDDRIVSLLAVFGMGPDLYAGGLGSPLPKAPDQIFAERLVASRKRLRESLEQAGLSELVEPFRADLFIENGSILENLLFGRAHPDAPITREDLMADRGFLTVLRETGLHDRLAEVGRTIANELLGVLETGAGEAMPASHAALLPLRDIPLVRAALEAGDASALVQVSFDYCEPRHRLGLVDESLRRQVLQARIRVAGSLGPALRARLHIYDADRFCNAASIRDNLLFGRVVQRIAGAARRIDGLLAQALVDLDLLADVHRMALDLPAGSAGKSPNRSEQVGLGLARALIKRPSALVCNTDLDCFTTARRDAILRHLREVMAERTLIVVTDDPAALAGFDLIVRFDGPRLQSVESVREDAGLRPLDLAG